MEKIDVDKIEEAFDSYFDDTANTERDKAARALAGVLIAEVRRLDGLINSPQTKIFFEAAVKLEAAHQQERWGVDHDRGKDPTDWYWLLGSLLGKSVAAFILGDVEKGKHHIISSAAVLLNWWRHITGEMTRFQPGSDKVAAMQEGDSI